MNKIIALLTIFASLVFACDTPKKKEQIPEGNTRNKSITPANAYNTLFLDSSEVEQFIKAQTATDSIGNLMRTFYNARNYQFAWFSDSGLTEQALGFRSLYKYEDSSIENNKKTDRMLDDMMTDDSVHIESTDPAIKNAELTLTLRFLRFATNDNRIKASFIPDFVPAKKKSLKDLTASVLADENKYSTDNKAFGLMRNQLEKYNRIANAGGWQLIPETLAGKSKQMKPGDSSLLIKLLKSRLHFTGEMQGNDSSGVYNAAVDTALKQYQLSHGFKPSASITANQIKTMNIPVQKRMQQLLLNMERLRWMPVSKDGKLIVVNIPEFVLHVYEAGNTAFDMDVIVGKEGHNTTMFYGDLNQVVFSPYWNLPSSIVRKEIMPAMARNKNYLKNHHMEITGRSGDLPQIRQLPGGNNSLGKVKFLFPNSFNIYFHDTPAKGIFKKENRAYSHGCIRLSDPVKMANYLLQEQPEWPAQRIDSAMNSGKEKYVKLKETVPVLITYMTAWINNKGILQFRDDIYQHDAILSKKLFVDAL